MHAMCEVTILLLNEQLEVSSELDETKEEVFYAMGHDGK